ncbi:MAG: hypothetical protein IT329_08660, partial [Caldilineaceae bacterium]|nr:hypothetical protein [Caldilineaceae bacterium]
ELPVRTLFEAMTVAQLAEVLETTRLAAQMLRPRSSHPDAERGPAPERAPLAERESPVEREPVEREEVEL